MNIEAHYEYFLLENCSLSSFDIDSQVMTSLNNVDKNTKVYEPSWPISNLGASQHYLMISYLQKDKHNPPKPIVL